MARSTKSPASGSTRSYCACGREDHWTSLFVTHNVSEAVFLSQRVLVMSTRPGRILADIPIPFPYPRSAYLRSDPEFIRLANGISRQLARADEP